MVLLLLIFDFLLLLYQYKWYYNQNLRLCALVANHIIKLVLKTQNPFDKN